MTHSGYVPTTRDRVVVRAANLVLAFASKGYKERLHAILVRGYTEALRTTEAETAAQIARGES